MCTVCISSEPWASFCSCALLAVNASYVRPSASVSALVYPLGFPNRSLRKPSYGVLAMISSNMRSFNSASENSHLSARVLAGVTKSSSVSSGFSLYLIRCSLCILKFTLIFS